MRWALHWKCNLFFSEQYCCVVAKDCCRQCILLNCYLTLPFCIIKVYEGRIPEDRVVLRELAKEMLAWPRIEVLFISHFSRLGSCI